MDHLCARGSLSNKMINSIKRDTFRRYPVTKVKKMLLKHLEPEHLRVLLKSPSRTRLTLFKTLQCFLVIETVSRLHCHRKTPLPVLATCAYLNWNEDKVNCGVYRRYIARGSVDLFIDLFALYSRRL